MTLLSRSPSSPGLKTCQLLCLVNLILISKPQTRTQRDSDLQYTCVQYSACEFVFLLTVKPSPLRQKTQRFTLSSSTFDHKSARLCPIAVKVGLIVPLLTSLDRLAGVRAKTEDTPDEIFLLKVYHPIASIARVPDS